MLCTAACCLAVYAFAHLGGAQSDALVVTEYVTQVPRKQERTFGYGGVRRSAPDASYQNPNVPFQSRVMSAFSFALAREEDGTFKVKGLDDRLRVNGERYEPDTAVELSSGDRFRTSGDYGAASFTFLHDGDSDEVRLRLSSPIYYRLDRPETRVTFGLAHEFVSAPVDEIFIRAGAGEGAPATYKLIKDTGGDGFTLEREVDLAAPPAGQAQPVKIAAGSTRRFGTVQVQLVGHAPLLVSWFNPGQLFGLKLAAALILLAFIFGFRGFYPGATRARLPRGPLIFGSVAALSIVGLTLTARDYFLTPVNQGRFTEYAEWLFRSLVVLFLLLVPLRSFRSWRWMAAGPLFLLLYCLISRPFSGIVSPPSLLWIVGFGVAFVALGFIAHYLMNFVWRLTDYLVRIRWQGIIISLAVVFAAVLAVTLATGGHSALLLGGTRVHLPTLLLPVVIYGVAVAVVAAESEAVRWQRARASAAGAVMLMIGVYYVASEFDHGGTAVLGVGALAAMWAAARRSAPKLFTAVLLGLVVLAVLVASALVRHERFEIAWGGEEGAQRYFDEAVNLRTARDMARAGGPFGLYEQLHVPSSVAMNIHNDLVAAYVAGFFGLLGLLLVMAAYLIFYYSLLDGIFELLRTRSRPAAVEQPPATPARGSLIEAMPPPVAPPPPPAPTAPGQRDEPAAWRHALSAYALGLVAVLMFQFVWVFTATLWRKVPFSGLDLQPVSASVISVVTFVVILLGSVATVHNLLRSYAPKQQG
jgi:hypothetical protein